jgi:hypothetical protein
MPHIKKVAVFLARSSDTDSAEYKPLPCCGGETTIHPVMLFAPHFSMPAAKGSLLVIMVYSLCMGSRFIMHNPKECQNMIGAVGVT